jgi:hypothetical protein
LRLALQSIQDLNVAVHRRAEYCWRIITPDFRELFNLSSEKLIEASRMIILLRIQPSLFHRPEARGAVEELELPTSSAKRMRASRW